MNERLAAIKVLHRVTQNGRNLPDALSQVNSNSPALTQAMCYGVLRHYHRLSFFAKQLLSKPLRNKDHDIQLLILLGLYQIESMRIPDHAAVSETVAVCRALKKDWARNLVNAVLRNFQRQKEKLYQQAEKNIEARFSHPQWLLDELKQSWPEDWMQIAEANNQAPPMVLRVNRLQTTRDDYLETLRQQDIAARPHPQAADAIVLETPCDVINLPGFDKGVCSVQDAAAQQAAILLNAQPGERVLDACAAPGGKTAHILEQQHQLQTLVALDIDAERIKRIEENLARLSLTSTLATGDAARPEQWWDRQPFDRILLDAPCSATGVIRRHPDIKLLRRAEDITELVKTQREILDKLWPLLKPGGMLVYATCSVLSQENSQQVQQFLEHQADAHHVSLEANPNIKWGRETIAGRQILPGENGMDGFFYAVLQKQH